MRFRSSLVLIALAVALGGCTSEASPQESAGTKTWDGTPMEYMQAFAGCLTEAGWEVTVDDRRPSLEADFPPGQREAFMKDDKACTEKLGRIEVPPVTPDSAGRRYEHFLSMRECLAEQGYETSEPPSKEQFISTALSGRPPWNPYGDIPPTIRQEEWESLLDVCPQSLRSSEATRLVPR